jgi:hypothetical protein
VVPQIKSFLQGKAAETTERPSKKKNRGRKTIQAEEQESTEKMKWNVFFFIVL